MRTVREMVHDGGMTLMIDLDPKAYDRVTAYAGAKGITLSDAVSELLLDSEKAPVVDWPRGRLEMNEYGYLVVAKTGYVITPEMVKETSEDELV
jgi:hypothetical protein